MIPVIDISGVAETSTNKRFEKGQKVIAMGHAIGISHTGGFSEYARIPADWLMPLPEELDLRSAMMIGTAGLTAALFIL